GVAGTVEEAEVRVAVQLGVGRGRGPAAQVGGRFVGGPPGRPGGTVAPVGALGHVAGTVVAARTARGPPAAGITARPAARQRALDLAPRDVGVVEAHGPSLRTCVRDHSSAAIVRSMPSTASRSPR